MDNTNNTKRYSYALTEKNLVHFFLKTKRAFENLNRVFNVKFQAGNFEKILFYTFSHNVQSDIFSKFKKKVTFWKI